MHSRCRTASPDTGWSRMEQDWSKVRQAGQSQIIRYGISGKQRLVSRQAEVGSRISGRIAVIARLRQAGVRTGDKQA